MENIKNILAGCILFGAIGLTCYIGTLLPDVAINALIYIVIGVIVSCVLWMFGKLVRMMFE